MARSTEWNEKLNTNSQCLRDVKDLHRAFYEVFDTSAALESVRTRTPQTPLLGAGRHFEAWQLKSRNPRTAMALVVKVAQSRFFPESDPQFRHRWIAGLRRIQHRQIPLIPPFEILEADETLALVMPLAPDRLDSLKPNWQPLESALQGTRQALADHHLSLCDMIQGGCWQGIPFVFDLSELVGDR